jgi:hypothetical protein
MDICCVSIKETSSDVYLPDADPCEIGSEETELQDNDSYSPDIDAKNRESQDKNSKVTESTVIDSPDKDPIMTESQYTDSEEIESEETESPVIDPENKESPDSDSADKQIYEGNFQNIPSITQSEIRIFLSSTFKGNIIFNI